MRALSPSDVKRPTRIELADTNRGSTGTAESGMGLANVDCAQVGL